MITYHQLKPLSLEYNRQLSRLNSQLQYFHEVEKIYLETFYLFDYGWTVEKEVDQIKLYPPNENEIYIVLSFDGLNDGSIMFK